ncbi:MAG: hypothetical protein QME63_04290 [Actinomycetota bacterium]|nr:hypothetical protein [Actinomycetota bacterium]
MSKLWQTIKNLHWLTILAIIGVIVLLVMLAIVNMPGVFDKILN